MRLPAGESCQLHLVAMALLEQVELAQEATRQIRLMSALQTAKVLLKQPLVRNLMRELQPVLAERQQPVAAAAGPQTD